MLNYILEAVAGYLLGSVSFSIILSKLQYKKDVRSSGSGNAGATNVARVFGMKAGIFTLVCDILKTLLPMALGLALDGYLGVAIAGVGAILGHCFPVFFGFKGGKGVSVAAAIALFCDWKCFLICIALFLVIVLITRYVSLGSVIAVTLFPITAALFSLGTERVILAVFTAVLVVFMHRSNISRLISGTESKFKPKSKD